MDSLNMQTKTILKTNKLYPHSFCKYVDGRKELIAICQSEGIHLFNLHDNQFIAQVKPQKQDFNGNVTCITESDEVAFFACGMRIGAVASNGRIVFNFDTYLAAQKIDSIQISGFRLWVFAGSMVNEFLIGGNQLGNKKSRSKPSTNKTEDIHSYVFDAQINYSVLIEEQDKPFLMLLKSNNQIICYDTKETLASYKTKSPPTCALQYPTTKPNYYIIGTMQGQVLCLKVSRKSLKLMWSANEADGKINTLLEMKNDCFMVCRDSKIQIWNHERQIIGSDQVDDKIISGCFVRDRQLLMLGTSSGRVSQMCDYDKLLKQFRKKNQAKQKETMLKEVQLLQKEKSMLEEKMKKLNKFSNKISRSEPVIGLDYNNFCYYFELQSQSPVKKIMIKGSIELISKQNLTFEGKEKVQGKQSIQTYTLEYDKQKNIKILFYFTQEYHEDCKLYTMIFTEGDQKTYAVTNAIQLKPMSLHNKITQPKIDSVNVLKITGQFKYFQMNIWLNSIFNNFGSSTDGSNMHTVCYESILTNQKIIIRYKNNECEIECEFPYSMLIIKKMFVEKSKQKHKSLNYTLQTSQQSIRKFINKISPKIKHLQELKKQNQLLPGLLEMRNEQNLSEDLRRILQKADDIQKQYRTKQREYESLKNQIKKCYLGFRKLNQRSTSQFQVDLLNREVSNFKQDKVLQRIFQ